MRSFMKNMPEKAASLSLHTTAPSATYHPSLLSHRFSSSSLTFFLLLVVAIALVTYTPHEAAATEYDGSIYDDGDVVDQQLTLDYLSIRAHGSSTTSDYDEYSEDIQSLLNDPKVDKFVVQTHETIVVNGTLVRTVDLDEDQDPDSLAANKPVYVIDSRTEEGQEIEPSEVDVDLLRPPIEVQCRRDFVVQLKCDNGFVLNIANPLSEGYIDDFIGEGLRAVAQNCNNKKECAHATGVNRKANANIYTGICFALDEILSYDMINCIKPSKDGSGAYLIRDEL
eukprot:Nk52_evm27s358 gene=Nk52_evmTU27s358